ncbi:MAG: hypothetical protein D6B27_12985 [Gammaproteobacteria bacterium]|nr:MAG: hypothetical protein D6B27_12985 [Gammaproteobacteria bacterium]
MKSLFFVAIIFFSMQSFSGDENVVVIAGADFSTNSISYQDLKRLYLGRATSVGSTEIEPVDLPANSKAREEFYRKVMRRTPEQMKRYWVRAVFTGAAKPPREVKDEAEMIEVVSSERALGYLAKKLLDDSIKELEIK